MFTEKIKAKEYYIKDLLSDKFLFEIPDYQRAYSWTKENLKQFMDDISDSININNDEFKDSFENYEPYFIGSIVLCSKEYKDDGWGLYDVIDGQQRLTSIIMLIATIRDIMQDESFKNILTSLIYQKSNELMGIKESIRVQVRGKELDFFKEYILTPGGTLKGIKLNKEELTEAKVNMINAIEVFRASFINEDGEVLNHKLNSFIKYLLQKLVLVVIITDSFTSAFRLFNVINARGLPLTNADLLKSENLRVINEDVRDKYTEIWENDEQDVGKEKLEKIIGFIRTMKLKRKATFSIFEEFNKKIFKNDVSFRGESFIECLHETKTLYSKYVDDGIVDLSLENKTYYKNLVNIMKEFLPFDEWISALLCFIQKFQNDEATLEFLKALEKRVVLDWVNGNSFSDRLQRVYKIIAVINDSNTVSDVIKSSVFLGDLDRTAIYFENSLNDIEFYSKGRMMVPKYILIRLNMEANNSGDEVYTDKIMLEHVLPRNAKESYWTSNFTTEQRRNWANRLGNLVLISGTKNTRANNKPFNEKMAQYILKKGDFAITREVSEMKEWNMKNLKDRHYDLVSKCKKLWVEN